MPLFRRVNALALLVLFFLIFLGGVVRSTGAGMGCPDWPKCFGQWVPPTDVSQLPADYQERYAEHGYASMAFNPVKTWTEYVNRLFGALTGLVIVATFLASLRVRGKDKLLFRLSGLNVLLVMLQGWLGSQVVASNLAEHTISLHFALAFLILFVALVTYWRSYPFRGATSAVLPLPAARLRSVLWLVLLVSTAQIFLGTELRAAVNQAIERLGVGAKHQWLPSLGWIFTAHKTWAVLVWLLNAGTGLYLLKNAHFVAVNRLALAMVLVVSLQVLTGVSLSVFDFPAVPQALHVVLAALLFAAQASLLLVLYRWEHLPDRPSISSGSVSQVA
jgi:cytochrome c oxidase assembly protein subunit 15